MSNKSIGNQTEQVVCGYLQEKGYWCHLFSYDKNGQPCDIIACKDNKTFLIDVKHCAENKFQYSRIEPNQQTCFEYARYKCGMSNVGFVLVYNDELYWLPFSRIRYDRNAYGKKSCKVDEMPLLNDIL